MVRMWTQKPWVSKTLMAVALVIGYVLHKSIIPPGYELHVGPFGVSLAGLLTDMLAALTAIGISGPQLWSRLAGAMGNGPAQPPAPPADPPKT